MKSRCYSVTMVTTKFVQPEFDRVIQKELIDIKLANFEEDLMLTLLWYNKNVKIHTVPMGIMEASFFMIETQAF